MYRAMKDDADDKLQDLTPATLAVHPLIHQDPRCYAFTMTEAHEDECEDLWAPWTDLGGGD